MWNTCNRVIKKAFTRSMLLLQNEKLLSLSEGFQKYFNIKNNDKKIKICKSTVSTYKKGKN